MAIATEILKPDPIEQYVIEKVRKLREEKNLRQRDIAEILNITASFVGNVENTRNPAKYNLKHIGMLCKFFRVPPSYFLPESYFDL